MRGSSFFFRHAIALLPILPLLWTPFLSDLLHSILIRNEVRGRPLSPAHPAGEALRLLPAFVRVLQPDGTLRKLDGNPR